MAEQAVDRQQQARDASALMDASKALSRAREAIGRLRAGPLHDAWLKAAADAAEQMIRLEVALVTLAVAAKPR